jgi:hypothetical protein
MNAEAVISTPADAVICKTLSKACRAIAISVAKSATSVGNGVTVAYRILGQAVEISGLVFQSPPIFNRLFPATSEAFVKLIGSCGGVAWR